MCSNKIKTIIIVCLMMFLSNNLSSTPRITSNGLEDFESYRSRVYQKYIARSRDVMPDELIIENFYLSNIPSEFGDAFLYYTEGREEIRMPFYSLMVHESGDFKSYVNKNKDGSYDYGPSQLNSKNINNPKFRNWYNPKDESHITTQYCFYMVMTINYFWDLYNKYGLDYTFYAYNGGERCVRLIKTNNKDSRNASLIKAVKSYDNKINNNISKFTDELNQYLINSRMQHIVKYYEKDIVDDISVYYTTRETLSKKDVKPKVASKNIDYIGYELFPYITRRKNFLYLKDEKLRIIHNSIINTFSV